MTSSMLGGVRTRARARRRAWAVGPSIREVCLVGIGGTPACPALEGAGGSGGQGHMTWSGRTYRVEATQARGAEGEADAPLRYVHLAALPRG